MQLMEISFLMEGKNLSRLLGGLGVTLQIAIISILLSAVLGIILGII
ncbi:MAG TPA: amino acid ABC transporter permease, partial [Candidatus Merdenecus merdavium]|nr:amino acid ABC transporter permease [Candidatus Merdenecus merdavium]